MTESAHHRMSPPHPAAREPREPREPWESREPRGSQESQEPWEPRDEEPFPFDTAGQLFARITERLGHQLSHVTRNGTVRNTSGDTPASPCPAPTLLVVAHGSRDPRALRTITALLDRVRELRPGLDVRLGHIELNEPRLPDTLAALGAGRAVLVPLLLSRGVHIKRDLPAFAAAVAPRLRTRIAAPLGPHPLLVEALYARLVEAGWPMSPTNPTERTRHGNRTDRDLGTDPTGHDAAIVLAAAGSRDPESAADTRRTALMLSERLGGVPVVPAYASAASPTVPEALRALAARGRHRTAIASYFTAPGYFATRSAAAGSGLVTAPRLVTAPLGAHPAMARLLLHRYDAALAAPLTSALRAVFSCRARPS
ncbi:sirohydrochlorin chelatase [Streptomyces sp. 35G-GA-8]|uniref:sirohydrochlorin chelatase n=1 Tax=Streptomyces sp. 35G-GA-8 TaxID=2939434 RepID=UPI00201EB8A5|nr:sirohydrochlorin chelatase [Streptomyces sp. 35G-GA-8]MCL7377240.1 sirohydrochlorin chelatase [Streptomyces sp. 35G-GA-8]